MKRKILFVDDEPLVLQGLQRMLHGMRSEWEMRFVDSGEKALALMEEEPVQVVVSDMRMPGMNGAQLMNLVMQRYPKTARLILSGFADHELVLRCVGSTHQYLSKPCDPATLRATVARAIDLEDSLASERLRGLVGKMDRLPSMPSLYKEILEKLQDPDVTLEAIGDTIEQDIGMTATILKIANSAFFGLRREVSSATDALTYLGMDTIKSLVLMAKAFEQFKMNPPSAFPTGRIWSHSMGVASLSRRIAAFEQLPSKLTQEAFLGGMLHDLGKVVLAFNFREDYEKVYFAAEKERRPLHELETEHFEANHAEAGGYLLGLWGLPSSVVEVIAFHHSPLACPTRDVSSLTIVCAANQLANRAENKESAADDPPDLIQYFEQLGFQDYAARWGEAVQTIIGD